MGNRWRGYEHPELYSMINTGPGAAASEPQTSYWQALQKDLTEVDEDLNAELTKLGSRWEGQAAESAQSGLTPLASWASDAELGAGTMKASTVDQAQFVSDARANMPPPVEVTTPAPSGWDIAKAAAAAGFGFTGPAQDVAQQADDHEAQEAAQNAAEQKAVDTMTTYESNSTWNRDTLGTFVAPPDVVVSTPAPQGGSASAVLYSVKSTNNVAENGTGTNGSGSSGSGTTGGHVQTVNQPTGTTNDPGSGGGGGGGGGGGVVTLPPTTNLPGTTNPSDVFLPPAPGPGPVPTPTPLPTPNPTPGPNTFLPGGGPVPSFGFSDNAGDIARRAMPLRAGLPGEANPFGRGGMPGSGGAGGLGAVDGERMPSQLGRGGAIGEGVVRNGPGAAGAAGRGGNGVNGPAGSGRRGEGEEDDEHYTPDYLLETDDVFGDDTRVAPTVIGE